MLDKMEQHANYNIIQFPLLTEKSVICKNMHSTFVFRVRKLSNKIAIRQAIEKIFNIKVISVHVLNVKGKSKHFKNRLGKRADWKKAYIKCDNNSIEILEKKLS